MDSGNGERQFKIGALSKDEGHILLRGAKALLFGGNAVLPYRQKGRIKIASLVSSRRAHRALFSVDNLDAGMGNCAAACVSNLARNGGLTLSPNQRCYQKYRQ